MAQNKKVREIVALFESRVDFDRDPGVWVDEWSATGIGHHWSLSLGHRASTYRAAASLLGIDFRQV